MNIKNKLLWSVIFALSSTQVLFGLFKEDRAWLTHVYNMSPYSVTLSSNDSNSPFSKSVKSIAAYGELRLSKGVDFIPWYTVRLMKKDFAISIEINHEIYRLQDKDKPSYGSYLIIEKANKQLIFEQKKKEDASYVLVIDYNGVPSRLFNKDDKHSIDVAINAAKQARKNAEDAKGLQEKQKRDQQEKEAAEKERALKEQKEREAAEIAKRKQEEDQRRAEAERKAKAEAEKVKADMERRKREEEEARKKAEDSARKASEAAEKLRKELEVAKEEQAKEALLKKINDEAQIAFDRLKKSEHRTSILNSDDAEKRMEQGLVKQEQEKYMHIDKRIQRAKDRYHAIVRLLADEGITWAPIPEVLEAVSQPMPPVLPPAAVSTPAPKAPTGLLGEIQRGTTLKKVSETSSEKPGKPGLLEDIRKGKSLRPVSEEEKKKAPVASKDDLRKHLEEGLARHRAGVEPEEESEEEKSKWR